MPVSMLLLVYPGMQITAKATFFQVRSVALNIVGQQFTNSHIRSEIIVAVASTSRNNGTDWFPIAGIRSTMSSEAAFLSLKLFSCILDLIVEVL